MGALNALRVHGRSPAAPALYARTFRSLVHRRPISSSIVTVTGTTTAGMVLMSPIVPQPTTRKVPRRGGASSAQVQMMLEQVRAEEPTIERLRDAAVAADCCVAPAPFAAASRRLASRAAHSEATK